MSTKLTTILGGMLLVVAFLAGTTQGCGSSSDSDNVVDLCNRGCDKYGTCFPEATAFVPQCKSSCTSMTSGGQTCSNQTAIVNAFKACLDVSCSALEGCLGGIPECQGGTGAAGSSGGGGSTGAAGSTGAGGAGGAGAADCSVCDKASNCCLATGQPAATCMSFNAATCGMVTGANQATIIQACQSILTAAAGSANPPAACR